MNGSYGRYRLARVLIGTLLALLVGVVAYNLGFSQGLAQHVAAPPPGAYYPWHPWGFGFFPIFFFILFWFFALRLLFWGVAGRGWRYGRGWGHGYGYGPGGGPPPFFDEWHRRAHERDREDRTVTSV